MTLQRQVGRKLCPAAPTKIPFVLPGRRTLSEHLPTEIIEVPITVVQRSRYLRRAIEQQGSRDLCDGQTSLPNVDAMGFRLYIEWLETGHVEFAPSLSRYPNGLLLRDAFDLIFAHIAGSQLGEPDFQDYIIDTLAKLLDPSQTPDLKVLEVVFLEKGASNILKQFVVDKMFAVERQMLGMIRGIVDSLDTAHGCEYHVHEEGECYKNSIKVKHVKKEHPVNVPHDFYSVRQTNEHSDIDSSRGSSLAMPCTPKVDGSTLYGMSETACSGSRQRSREVHWPPRKTLRTDKPLPTMPPLTPGPSPPPVSSPRFSPPPISNTTFAEPNSTQQLISECLARWPQSDASSIAPSVIQDPQRSDIPVLILECLERFKKTSLTNASTFSSSESSSTADRLSPDVIQTPRLQMEERPVSQCQIRWQPSFEELPKPSMIRAQAEEPPSPYLHAENSDYHSCAKASQSDSSTPSPTSTVKRKAAPHRGEDWLNQYDSINAFRGNIPITAAKRSRRSRFVEMLRSESTMGRLELEGSVLKVRRDSESKI